MSDLALFRSANHWLSDEREWRADSEPRKNERVPSCGFSQYKKQRQIIREPIYKTKTSKREGT